MGKSLKLLLGPKVGGGSPPPSAINLPQTGSTAVSLSAFYDMPAGSDITVENTTGNPFRVKFTAPIGAPAYVTDKIAPSAAWLGVYGQGYTGSAGDPDGRPVILDPVASRAAGMPVASSLTHDFTSFIDDFPLMVVDETYGGLSHVTFYVEGNQTDVTIKRPYSYVGFDGETYTDTLWPCEIDWSDCGQDGDIEWYAKLWPNDPAMAPRTIGPYRCSRRTTTRWDHSVVVGASHTPAVAGVSYPTLLAALQYIGDQDPAVWQHVLIRHDADENIDISAQAGGTAFRFGAGAAFPSRIGYIDVLPDPGVTVKFFTSTYFSATDSGWFAIQPGLGGLRLGPGVEYDCDELTWSGQATTPPLSMAGCEVYNRNGLFAMRGTMGHPQNHSLASNFIMYETYWHDVSAGPTGSWFTRNIHVADFWEDVHKRGRATDCCFWKTRVERHNSKQVRTIPDCFAITYTGPQATATVSCTPSLPGIAGRVFTLSTTAGVVEDIPLSITHGSGIYTLADLAAYINTTYGASGWLATVLDNRFRAISLGGVGPGSSVPEILNEPVKNVTYNAPCGFDAHGDGLQYASNTVARNILHFGMVSTEAVGSQEIFTDASSSVSLGVYDCATVYVQTDESAISPGSISQWYGRASHYLVEENTLSHQPFTRNQGGTLDVRVTARNNLFARTGGFVAAEGDVATFQNNHSGTQADGTVFASANSTGNTVGGTAGQIVGGWAAGDFACTDLDQTFVGLKPNLRRFDFHNNPRPSSTVPGAIESYASIPAGETFTFPGEWVGHCVFSIDTLGAIPGVGVGSVTVQGDGHPDLVLNFNVV